MDEKKLKQLLDKELESIAPSMSEKVKKARILTKPEQREKSTQKIDVRPVKRSARPFIYGAVAAVLVIAIALAVILPPMLGGNGTDVPVYQAGYLRMDINPSVEFVYDKDNKVTAVKSANSDADLLLSGELVKKVQGMPVEQAVAIVAEEAGKLGYISPDEDNAVMITVVEGNAERMDKIIADTKAAIENSFMKNGVFVAVVAVKENADWLAQQYGTAANSLSEAVNGVVAKADSYFEQLAADNQSGLAVLKSYYEKEVFGYLKDLLQAECLKITRTRELLHQASDLNDAIKSYNLKNTWLATDYWDTVKTDDWKEDDELVKLCAYMSDVLGKIEVLRDDAVDNSADLLALVLAYDWFIDENLLQDIGNATLDELKGSLDDIVEKLEKLNVEITSAIRNALAFVPGTVQEFLDGTQAVIDSMREELNEIYLEYYSDEREELSQEDYDARYQNIIEEYGSLEAYWQSREAE